MLFCDRAQPATGALHRLQQNINKKLECRQLRSSVLQIEAKMVFSIRASIAGYWLRCLKKTVFSIRASMPPNRIAIIGGNDESD